jgi:hypothetical protein
MIKFQIATLLCLLVVSSCKKKAEPDFHFDYFPIVQNQYVTYAVTEITIDQTVNQSDTLNYFMKVQIGDIEIDNQGRNANRVYRYTSSSISGPWVLKDIWTSILNGNKAELYEENNRIIKLVFAPSKSKSWNANAYTTLGELNCYYDQIHKKINFGSLSFDSTITVEQQDELNFIQYKRKFEIYAKGVGLVRKFYKDFEINNSDTTNVKKGKELQMTVVDYSN